ncbi:hypothetical protein [Burkholderia sp. 8Y]|uniref:hypothetical protein n=1 Tax=Burkholderia sp. 8Y TaxID=2653133 RepID=UPI001356E455|nr:hypothetical protein [Burkholderia sp. 8Y]
MFATSAAGVATDVVEELELAGTAGVLGLEEVVLGLDEGKAVVALDGADAAPPEAGTVEDAGEL